MSRCNNGPGVICAFGTRWTKSLFGPASAASAPRPRRAPRSDTAHVEHDQTPRMAASSCPASGFRLPASSFLSQQLISIESLGRRIAGVETAHSSKHPSGEVWVSNGETFTMLACAEELGFGMLPGGCNVILKSAGQTRSTQAAAFLFDRYGMPRFRCNLQGG